MRTSSRLNTVGRHILVGEAGLASDPSLARVWVGACQHRSYLRHPPLIDPTQAAKDQAEPDPAVAIGACHRGDGGTVRTTPRIIVRRVRALRFSRRFLRLFDRYRADQRPGSVRVVLCWAPRRIIRCGRPALQSIYAMDRSSHSGDRLVPDIGTTSASGDGAAVGRASRSSTTPSTRRGAGALASDRKGCRGGGSERTQEAVQLLAQFAGVAIDHACPYTRLGSCHSELRRAMDPLDARCGSRGRSVAGPGWG